MSPPPDDNRADGRAQSLSGRASDTHHFSLRAENGVHRYDGEPFRGALRAGGDADGGAEHHDGGHAGGTAHGPEYTDGSDADGGNGDGSTQRHDSGHAGGAPHNGGDADGSFWLLSDRRAALRPPGGGDADSGAERHDGTHAGGAAHDVRYADGGGDNGGALRQDSGHAGGPPHDGSDADSGDWPLGGQQASHRRSSSGDADGDARGLRYRPAATPTAAPRSIAAATPT